MLTFSRSVVSTPDDLYIQLLMIGAFLDFILFLNLYVIATPEFELIVLRFPYTFSGSAQPDEIEIDSRYVRYEFASAAHHALV